MLPLSVHVEETLQYNVFSASGPEWDRFLGAIDDEVSRRGSGDATVFRRADEAPMRDVLDKLAAGGGSTHISFSRPGGDRHYRVARHVWTRQDFRPWSGLTGTPAPPPALLYILRGLGIGSVLVGLVLFVLLPGSGRDRAQGGPSAFEIGALGVGLLFFAVPLMAVGGFVQALTRGLWLAVPCWIVAAHGVGNLRAGRAGVPGDGLRAARVPDRGLADALEPVATKDTNGHEATKATKITARL